MVETTLALLATTAGTTEAIAAAGATIGPVTAAASGLGTIAATTGLSIGTLTSIGGAVSTGFSLLSGLGTVGGIIGQISAGNQQAANYKLQAGQAENNAALEKVKAEDQANVIRRQLLANIATGTATFASRGIGIGSGTPAQAQTESAKNAALNIERARFGGDSAAANENAQAAVYRGDASASRTAGYGQAALTISQSKSIRSLISS